MINFNHFVLVLAILIGISGGFLLSTRARRVSPLRALAETLLVGLGLSIAAIGSAGAWPGHWFFAVDHQVYLIATISVPLGAAVALLLRGIEKRWLRGLLVLALLPAPAGLYATHVEPFWLRVDHVELAVNPLLEGELRIGVLSDLQTRSIGEYERDAVAQLIQQSPDLVLIPGDFYQLSPAEFELQKADFAGVMQQLSDAVPHVIAVSGDADRVERLEELTAGTNVIVLDNSVSEFTIDGTPVRVLGITVDGNETQLSTATKDFLDGNDGQTDPLRIILSHRPEKIQLFSETDNFDLLVSGHTHGGQIAFPLIGPLLTLDGVPQSVGAGGLHEIDGHPIYVSTGVGMERYRAPQVRFGVRPSIGLIVLHPK